MKNRKVEICLFNTEKSTPVGENFPKLSCTREVHLAKNLSSLVTSCFTEMRQFRDIRWYFDVILYELIRGKRVGVTDLLRQYQHRFSAKKDSQ